MNLKELRKSKGLTQTEVAKYLNVATNTYCWYELKKIEPPMEALKKLADYYDVSLDYLCGHKTKHLIDTSMWDKSKKAIVNIVEQLSLQNSYIVLGYVSHILKQQNE